MEPKVIAVANTKGGVGKTTVALQIAIARALQGKEVFFVDGDRQQTGLNALALRSAQNMEPTIACASYPEGTLLRTQVRLQKDKWDTIVIDVGGFDNSALRAAVLLCDALVVPFQPRNFDVWGLAQMHQVVKGIQDEIKGEFPVYAVINCADAGSALECEQASAAIGSDYRLFTLLPERLGRRKAFSTASGFGMSVMEMPRKDPKAILELRAIMKRLFPDTD